LIPRHSIPSDWRFEHRFDGGEKACSELVMDLRQFLLPLPAGTRVCVIAHDAGAWIDIPAWCRVTGHGYIAEAPPYYLLERK
jgi:tRNA 2-thiouridine synthesizing protein A